MTTMLLLLMVVAAVNGKGKSLGPGQQEDQECGTESGGGQS